MFLLRELTMKIYVMTLIFIIAYVIYLQATTFVIKPRNTTNSISAFWKVTGDQALKPVEIWHTKNNDKQSEQVNWNIVFNKIQSLGETQTSEQFTNIQYNASNRRYVQHTFEDNNNKRIGQQPIKIVKNFSQQNNYHVQIQSKQDIISELESKAMQFFDHDNWFSQISDDAVQMYFMWPGIDGLLTLYEATGKTEYVGYVVEYCKRYQSMGKDMNSDGYLDWYSQWIDGFSHCQVEWRADVGVARTVALILTDDLNLTAYVDDALGLKTFLEKHVWEKYTGGYNNYGDSTNVTHFIGRFGLIAVSLYQVTGDKKYLNYINNKGNQLKNALRKNSQGAYIWGTYTNRSGIVDVSHAGDAINFMVEAHRIGLVYDEEDIRYLCNTVKQNLWNGSLSSPQFKNNVDGSGGYGRSGINQGGWIKLAQFDPELQNIYYVWLKNLISSSFIMVQFCGNLARSIHLSSLDTRFKVAISADPFSGVVPLTVNFTASMQNGTSPYSYSWDFGDSTTSDQQSLSHTYNQTGSYTIVLIVIDHDGKNATDSVMINVIDPSNVLSITDVKFTHPDQSEELTKIQRDTWYDLYLYFNTPNGWSEIAFSDVWMSGPSYTEGTIGNRGSSFHATSNYVISLTIVEGYEGIWSRQTEGSKVATDVTGTLGLYVDDRNNQYEINRDEGWTKVRIKLLTEAENRSWTVNAYVKNLYGINSALYKEHIEVVVDETVDGIDEDSYLFEISIGISMQFNLQQNHPNPFNSSTEICYTLPHFTDVDLSIFNTLGQHIVTLVKERQPSGQWSVSWNGRDEEGMELSSGFYYYRLKAGDFTIIKQMLLLR